MLNGDDNETGFKTNRSNQQKTNCTSSTPFLLISKKKNLHVQHAFLSFPCRCFAQLQLCFVRLKRQTSLLHIIFMEELFPVFMSAFIFHCRSFSPCWPLLGSQHFSFSHRHFEFPCFSSYEIRLNNSLQLFLCYPRQCKHKK